MATLAFFGGMAMLLLAFDITVETRGFAANAIAVSGEIVGVREAGGTGTGFWFQPVVRFRSNEREVVTFVASETMNPGDVVGQKVDVFYDPKNPEHAHIGTRSVPWGQVLYLSLLGSVLLGAGANVFWERPKTSEPAAIRREFSTGMARLLRISKWTIGFGMIALIAEAVLERQRVEHALAAARGTCVSDADCHATFCDRGLCAPKMGETPHFGARCTPSTAPQTGKERGDEATCGAFVCREGRCKSCANDAECQPGAEWAQLCMKGYWGLSLCADHPGDMDP